MRTRATPVGLEGWEPRATRSAGDRLLHPAAATSLVVLVVNDHALKRLFPGFVTGKLSDLAGVMLLPLFAHALYEVVHVRCRGRLPGAVEGDRVLAAAIALTTLAFAAMQLSHMADVAYRFGLGAMQWPFRALASWLGGAALPSLVPVRATPDASDLLALPMGWVAWRVGRARGGHQLSPPRPHPA